MLETKPAFKEELSPLFNKKKPPVPSSNSDRVAVIINLSGHRMPTSTFKWLKDSGYARYSLFSTAIDFDYETDIWQQVETIVKDLSEQRDINGQSVFDVEGTLFLCAPARGAGAIMLYEAISSLFGISPQLILVSHDSYSRKHEIKQVIDLRAFANKFRSYWRARYILGCDSGVLDEKIARK